MARRRRTSTAEDLFDLFHDVFMHVPSWVCLPTAAVIFVLIKLLLVKVAAGQFLLQAMEARYGIWVAGIGAAIVLLAGFAAEIQKRRRRSLLDQQRGLDTIRALSWRDFELLVGETYRRLGYDVAETGGGGADGGIDLRLRNSSGQTFLVQCKQWRAFKVGVKPVRELYGVLTAERAARAIFVTTGVYTQEAKNFAQGKPMELIDGEQLAQLIAPVHSVAPAPFPSKTSAEPLNVSTAIDEMPACPICGSAMTRRIARKGANAGSEFWGCSEYPKCRGTRDF